MKLLLHVSSQITALVELDVTDNGDSVQASVGNQFMWQPSTVVIGGPDTKIAQEELALMAHRQLLHHAMKGVDHRLRELGNGVVDVPPPPTSKGQLQ